MYIFNNVIGTVSMSLSQLLRNVKYLREQSQSSFTISNDHELPSSPPWNKQHTVQRCLFDVYSTLCQRNFVKMTWKQHWFNHYVPSGKWRMNNGWLKDPWNIGFLIGKYFSTCPEEQTLKLKHPFCLQEYIVRCDGSADWGHPACIWDHLKIQGRVREL